MPDSPRVEMIRERIDQALNPAQLEIIDESHLHVGHTGHGGAGHFKVRIVSDKFENETLVSRHRMVYLAVNDLMPDEIHALSIDALTMTEASE